MFIYKPQDKHNTTEKPAADIQHINSKNLCKPPQGLSRDIAVLYKMGKGTITVKQKQRARQPL